MHKFSALIFGGILLAGCANNGDSFESGSQAVQPAPSSSLVPRTVQVSIVCPAQPIEMTEAIKSGADSASQTLQVNEGVKIVTNWRPYKSQAELQDALQASVLNHDSALLFRPDPSYSIDTQLKQIASAGIKVVTLGTDLKKSQRAVFCGIPNEKLGNRLGYTIGNRKDGAKDFGVIFDSTDTEKLKGLRDVTSHFSNVKLTEFPLKKLDVQQVLSTIHSHPEHPGWVVFQSEILANPEQLASLDPKKVEILTLGCWPRQLPLLESGLLKPLSLPSYELGYLALCRAVDIVAFHRKTDDTYMIATPMVDSKSVRSYALTMRRWGFSDVASRYLDTVRTRDTVR